MCGFIGSWHPKGRHPEALTAGLAAIAHRGPDGEGWHDLGRVRFGHRRLSIVDVAGGKQPLFSEDQHLCLVHNGEIYNHRAVLAGLRGDHQPRTHSDGEAWLHAAEERGPAAAVSQLHGMFALAGSDGESLCLGRDALGIKPLYWSRHDKGLIFASEIKALLPVVPPETIEVFPPGHVYTSTDGIAPMWRLPAGWSDSDQPRDPAAWADAFLAALDDAVRQRLMADVPVGVFLSGGLDSSLIAALMRRYVPELHSFAVGLPGSNDLERAREVAADLGTIHHEVAISEAELIAALDDVIWHLESWDPDLVRSALPCWFVSREAAKHMKVVLTGEGADELFAGYAYHRDYHGAQLHRELRRSINDVTFSVPAGSICALMGGSGSGKTTLLKLVNRMERASAGDVCLDGQTVDSTDAVILRRSIGYVIQEGGLFPHWTAERNVGLVPHLLGCDQRTSDELVTSAMDMARIPRAEFGRRRPDQLSGGQRQRVAIARAIAARPRLLLLDEPFGALDPAIRAEMQDELRALVKRLGCTVILVTHDIAEAFAVADRIVLIDLGRLVQIGSPVEIALSPSDAVAAAFTAKQALELRLRYLRLADVAQHLPICPGDSSTELPGERTIADALGALARVGGERFTVVHQGERLGPFERRAVWDLLQRGAA